MKNKIKIFLPLILSSTLLLSSCGQNNEANEEGSKTGFLTRFFGEEEVEEVEVVKTAVETTVVNKSSIKTELEYAGQIQSLETVSVMGKISGTVTSTNKNIGDRVTAGEVLFTIDRKDVENQIKQLEAQVKLANQGVNTAQNSLNTIEGSQYQSSLIQMEAGIESTRTQIENANIALENAMVSYDAAEKNYNNSKTLYDGGVMSKNDFEAVERGLTQAKAGVDQAKNGVLTAETSLAQQISTYELTKNKAVAENKKAASLGVNQATASVESAQVQLDIARQSLEDTSTKSPISGIVSGKNAVTGQIISPQNVAYTISNMDQVNVQVKVSEMLINKIAVGNEIQVKVNSIDTPLVGRITEINPVADQTSTYPIKITLDNPDHLIKPGMFATVIFETDKSENTIVLPHQSVLREGESYFVFTENNGVVKKVEVEVGLDNGESIEIIGGLLENDVVVTKGQTYIEDGEEVNVVNKGE